MKKSISTLLEVSKAMESAFSSSHLNQLVQRSGFIRRQRSGLCGREFLKMMILETLGMTSSLANMCFSLKQLLPSMNMSPQALGKRLHQSSTVCFLKESFLFLFEKHQQIQKEGFSPSLLAVFPQVITEDSTICTLHPHLSPHFTGCRGKGSKSSIKLHVIHELKQTKVLSIDLTEGKLSDGAHGKKIFDFLQPGGLIIRDLGYFSLELFKIISEEYQAFFLSRFKVNTLVYQNPEDIEPIALSQWLDNQPKEQCVFETHFYLGVAKYPCRLVAYRLPKQIADYRKRVAEQTARKKGRKLSDRQKKLLEFALFITNVPAEIWQAEVVGTIYRLRWQQELTFKRWKSLLKLDYLQGKNPNRIYCLLYAKLISILLIESLYAVVAPQVWSYEKRQLSLHKWYQWFIQGQKIIKVFENMALYQLLDDLLWANELTLLCQHRLHE